MAALSRPDLRALFRTNSRALMSTDVFANREVEWAAVLNSLGHRVAANRDPAFDVEDVQQPRRNVLMFYGVGGIGKTTLSQQIHGRLADPEVGPSHWPPLGPELGRILPVRIDLSRQNGASLEAVMLAIRLTVAELGRPMPAFDLAFYRYWAQRHPAEPLQEYLKRHTFLSRFPGGDRLRGQMESGLGELAQALAMPGTIGSLIGAGLRATVGALREHRRAARALAGCRRLPDLLEAEPDQDALSYYAHLLAWDLQQLPPGKAATLVILLDTFEDTGDRSHRDFERLLQRIAWLMPNVLVIITGRNRLQWDDQRLEGQLDWAGPANWPQLVPGTTADPHQYRIGYLSQGDSESYLQRRLTLEDQPLMDPSTRRIIITHSRGLPLYLDMAVMRFLDLYERHGHAPSVTEFDHEFPALVARIFRDLSNDERNVLRAVSLLDSFSIELATSAAGLDRDAPVLQLTDRPFVEQTPGALWPYHLHDLVRTAVRDTDSTSEDSWSPADWQRAAQRTFDALGQEFATHRHDPSRRGLIGSLRQGLRLARDFNLELSWLGDAAFAYVQDFVWEPIELDSSDLNNPAVALTKTLTAIARRQRQHRSITADQLHAIIESDLLPAELQELPRYFLAECERDLGNLSASLDGMRAVATHGNRLAPDAARGLLHLARRLGHFPDVITAAAGLGAEGKKERTVGELLWTQGSIGLACAAFARGRDEALQHEQHGEAALCQAYLAFAAAFQDRARTIEQIARADHMLSGANARFAQLQVRNAQLLANCGLTSDLPAHAATVSALATESGLSSCVAYARFAACFHAAIVGSPHLIDSSRAWLSECVNGEEFAYLLELTYFMVGDQPPPTHPLARWIDGADVTRARWSQLVTDRRQELASPQGE